MITAGWLRTPAALEAYASRWDALARACDRPYACSGWALAWWRHLADERCTLQAVIVTDGDELIGIAPFYSRPWFGGVEYRLLGSTEAPRIEPLAVPGREREVAAALAEMLATADEPVARVHFGGIPTDSCWPALLADAWSGEGRTAVHRTPPAGAPTIALPSGLDYDGWMAAKSRSFRYNLRRSRRQLDELGAKFAVAATEPEITAGVEAIARLHAARHPEHPPYLTPQRQAMLVEAAGSPLRESWFRLESMTIDDEVISAHLYLSAGGETAHWNGGFDERWATYSPSVVSLLAAVEHGFEFGHRRIDLGQGMDPYKVRLADAHDLLEWSTLVPPGPLQRRTLAVMAPSRMRVKLAERLSEQQKAGLRTMAERATSVLGGRARSRQGAAE